MYSLKAESQRFIRVRIWVRVRVRVRMRVGLGSWLGQDYVKINFWLNGMNLMNQIKSLSGDGP